jgi:hypothetical protein
MPPPEIIEQIDCGRYTGGQVEDEVRQHDDIGIMSYNRTSTSYIGIDYPCP